MSVSVRVVKATDLAWAFDSKPPGWTTKPALKGNWGHRSEVDATPAYPHDLDLVKAEAERVDAAFPIGVPVTVHISLWEDLGRTNGWAYQDWAYRGDDERTFEVAIALGAKRIPIHPAMTRYLVAHEYGHAVDYWLCHVREVQPNGLDEEYRKLRGLPKSSGRYGPGRWHANVGELIANDFRILVAKREPEFWPHPGIARPEALPAVRAWWRKALKEAS